jgi:hypothetical protein
MQTIIQSESCKCKSTNPTRLNLVTVVARQVPHVGKGCHHRHDIALEPMTVLLTWPTFATKILRRVQSRLRLIAEWISCGNCGRSSGMFHILLENSFCGVLHEITTAHAKKILSVTHF